MDNDYKFNLANKLINNYDSYKNEVITIYKDLFKNNYNDYNIGLWLINSNDVDHLYKKNLFYNLLKKYNNENDKLQNIKGILYPKFLFESNKFDLSINEIDNFQKDYSLLLSDIDFLKNNKVDFFTFNCFSDINNLYNIKYLIKEDVIKHRINEYNIKNDKIKIAILSIGINSSPNFYHFIEVYYYLSKINKDIKIFLENKEEDLNDYCKKMLKDIKVYYIKDLDNNQVYDLIKLENIDILLSMYGHFTRYDILLRKPCKILINGPDGGWIFPSFFMDYNLSFKNNIIKNNDEYKFIKLKHFLPIYKKTNFKIKYKKPLYSNKIRIGLITTPLKISKDLILLIKKILNNNNNIILTIYGYNLNDYLRKLLNIYDENKLIIKMYDNSTNNELKYNLFYLDTFIYNGHTTIGEIISAYRPIISYYNKDKIAGSFSYSVIKNLNMETELSADNIDDYYKLIIKYSKSEKEYYKMFNKFKKNLIKSKMLDNKFYAKCLFDNLISIYKKYNKSIKNKSIKNKLLLILYGESFREGNQHSRIRDTDYGFYTQKKATMSHISFCKFLKNIGIDTDIIINTYDTKYENNLKEWYSKFNLKYISNRELIGVDNLVNNAIKSINNLNEYDSILTTRLDIFLKAYFKKIFNKNWNKIMFISQNWTLWNFFDNGDPCINPIIQFIPKKYLYINFISVDHNAWSVYKNMHKLTKNDMDFMLDYYHDADSYKDYNPVYRIVSREENKIWYDKGIKINRDLLI